MLELVVRLVFSLAVVVGMLLLLARFSAKRFRGSAGSLVRVVHRQPLSRTSAVAVVTVGSRVLVLGTTEQQVQLLTELDLEEIGEPADDAGGPVGGVRAATRRLGGDRAGAGARSSEGRPRRRAHRRRPARDLRSPGRRRRPGRFAAVHADLEAGVRRRHREHAGRLVTDLSTPAARRSRAGALLAALLVALLGWLALGLALADHASATPVPSPSPSASASPAPSPAPSAGPSGPQGPSGPSDPNTVTVELNGLTDKPSTPVVTILALTLLSVAPAILLTTTSFTKVLVVLGLTRNALGLQQIPPNQVLAGLALFLSLFIMAPVLSQVNDDGVQPYLNGDKNAGAAYEAGVQPLKDFMLDNTDDGELQLLTNVAHRELPKNPDQVSLATLVPAFILTELKQAFIIGFVIFVPFLVIDIVVSGALMALGMMMMPPVMVSLPFKLLLFVMVDGWALVIKSLVSSYG